MIKYKWGYMMKKDKNIKDLEDWQSKQYSPGNFIGTGKVPRPLLGLSRFPKILILIGIFSLSLALLFLLKRAWLFSLFNFGIAVLFLYGGIIRTINKKK